MPESGADEKKALADQTRSQFLKPGEKFEGYHIRHIDRSNQGENINYNYFMANENREKEYRISSGNEFVIALEPEKVMSAEEYLNVTCGQNREGLAAYAVYSKPRVQASVTGSTV